MTEISDLSLSPSLLSILTAHQSGAHQEHKIRGRSTCVRRLELTSLPSETSGKMREEKECEQRSEVRPALLGEGNDDTLQEDDSGVRDGETSLLALQPRANPNPDHSFIIPSPSTNDSQEELFTTALEPHTSHTPLITPPPSPSTPFLADSLRKIELRRKAICPQSHPAAHHTSPPSHLTPSSPAHTSQPNREAASNLSHVLSHAHHMTERLSLTPAHQQSHDSVQQSHDPTQQSQDNGQQSHDTAQQSHDTAQGSHDNAHDLTKTRESTHTSCPSKPAAKRDTTEEKAPSHSAVEEDTASPHSPDSSLLANQSFVVTETIKIPRHFHRLTNQELRQRLLDRGERPGPVTELTRAAYLLYLAKLEAGIQPAGNTGYKGE